MTAAASLASAEQSLQKVTKRVCADLRRLLLAWALLLAHLQSQPATERGRMWLTESLAEVDGCAPHGQETFAPHAAQNGAPLQWAQAIDS